jgi:hypothetical protein
MGDRLLPFPQTERSVRLSSTCSGFFRPKVLGRRQWMDEVLPVVAALANRHPERTVLTRSIAPERPDQMPGMWRRYYRCWRVATRERLDLRLLELMPPLAALCPPATVIDKTRYSVFAEPRLIEHLRQRETGARPMFVCSRQCWTRLILATASSSCATQYAALLTKGTKMLLRIYHTRYTEQIETADAATILARWE